ncbi:MAG TPA: TlpA disulfide reductase family protein [Myxococcaceae bacterium]|nr:TlpA disulfide reductase family protein [Myxococcaceae bacterium]
MLPVLLAGLMLGGGCDHYARPNEPLPESFEAQTLDGQPLHRGSFVGKPWVIALWVPGCGTCARELPELEAVRHVLEGRGVGFLALSLEPDAELVRRGAEALGLKMTVATTEGEVLAPLFVNQVPSTVFLDAFGRVVAAASGARGRAFLERRTRALLQ